MERNPDTKSMFSRMRPSVVLAVGLIVLVGLGAYFSFASHASTLQSGVHPSKPLKRASTAERVSIDVFTEYTLNLDRSRAVAGEFVKLELVNTSFKIVNTATLFQTPSVGKGPKEVWIHIKRSADDSSQCFVYYSMGPGKLLVRRPLFRNFGVKYFPTPTSSMLFTCTPEGHVQVLETSSQTNRKSTWLIKTRPE